MLLASVPGIAQAVPEQDICHRLVQGLHEEVRLLSSIGDEASAESAVEPLCRVMQQLDALHSQVNEDELWLYIDNTPGIKQPLIEEIERLFVQLQRLEDAEFYGSKTLQEALEPLLNGA